MGRNFHSIRTFAGVFAVALVTSTAVVTTSYAQQGQSPAVTAFLANPGQILQQNPNGGPEMIAQLRAIAVADPAALQAIVSLIGNANKGQKDAIGEALGQAALIVVRTNQAYANEIQQAIAQSKDDEVVKAFAQLTGNIQLGGVGAGPGGGGGGGGGGAGGQTSSLPGIRGGGGPAENIPGGFFGTSPYSYTSSVSGTGGTSTTTTSTFTITSSVSP